MDSIRAETLLHSIEQQHLKLAAVDADLRDRVAGIVAPRLDNDGVPEIFVVIQLAALNANRSQSFQEAEIARNQDGRTLDVDAHAEGRERAACFEEVDTFVTVGVEVESTAKAPDPSSSDDGQKRCRGGCWLS